MKAKREPITVIVISVGEPAPELRDHEADHQPDRDPAGGRPHELEPRVERRAFEDGSFDAVISNGVVNLSADKRRVFVEAARVLRPGGRLALADIVTDREIAARTSAQADLWAACIAGASQRDQYLEDIEASGLELQVIQDNPAYRFTSDRAQRTSDKYGARSVSLLAVKALRT